MVITDSSGNLTGYAKCSRCGETKPFSDFYKKKTTKYGIKSSCKQCEQKERKAYYKNNKQKEFENDKKYVSNNTEKINKQRSIRRKKNPNYYKKHHQ